jgi:hypothetical protein
MPSMKRLVDGNSHAVLDLSNTAQLTKSCAVPATWLR